MIIKLENSFAALKPDDPMAGFNGMMYLSNGLSTEKCMQSVMGPVALDMGDFITQPSLYALSRLPAMDANAAANEPQPAMAAHAPEDGLAGLFAQLDEMAPPRRETIEDQLAKDLYRRGSHNGIQGFSPVISFGVPGQPVQSVDVHDMAGLTEAEQADFREGKPNPISARLIRHCRELCNGNEVQARVLAMGLTQAGTMATRTLSPATGEFNSEHAPHHMDARRQDDGSVTLRIYTPDSSLLNADYTYTIQPNGENRLTDFHMHGLHNDPRFLAMPEHSKAALLEGMATVRASIPQAMEQQAALVRLRNDFFGIMPETYDINAGMQRFKDENLIADFLKPTQQGQVNERGMHESFFKDAERGSIGRMGNEPTPGNRSKEFYEEKLLNIFPEEHRRFLPFVSMMASQAGMDSALSFLPFLSGASDPGAMHLNEAGILVDTDEHSLDLIPTERGLRMELTFSQPFRTIAEDRDNPHSLFLNGRLTMDIDFTAEPSVHQVDVVRNDQVVGQRTVYVPQCTLLDGDVHFETPRV